jgi:hypothetical protein
MVFLLRGGEDRVLLSSLHHARKGNPFFIMLYNQGNFIHQPATSFYEAQTGEFILEAEELL